MSRKWRDIEGSPNPQGVIYVPEKEAYNFSIFSKNALRVRLLIYGEDVKIPIREIELNPRINKTQSIWHIRVPCHEIPNACYYGYRIWGPSQEDHQEFHSFDPNKILVDPFARNIFFPTGFSRRAASIHGRNDGKAPLGVLPPPIGLIKKSSPDKKMVHHDFDLILYELHVRQFTKSETSGVDEKHRGTFQGIIDKIPYLKELGITAVELMPIQQVDPQEGSTWGYMTLNYFTPNKQYAADQSLWGHINEFRTMVDALHDADIYCILDVVYNHTTEGDLVGPIYSFKGIDNSEYYMAHKKGDFWDYADFSGTGNTFYSAKAQPRRLILDSLRFWVSEMHIDGFRFDLGSIFALDISGQYQTDFYSVIDQISNEPILRDIILIAEPWDGDLDDQGYLLGENFPGVRWKQWNDRARSHFRQFIKGDNGMVNPLMTRLYGSNDLFPGPEDDLKLSNKPPQSLNYINSHDGFTLFDQVSFTNEQQQSWDCGWEGVEIVPPQVMALRRKQIKNFITLLMLSNGTPMFRAGDEFMQTQHGQIDPYNIDDKSVWIDWDLMERNNDIFNYFKKIINFRKEHPSIARGRFWQEDVVWFGTNGTLDESYHSHTLAYFLAGENREIQLFDNDLYVMINSYWEPMTFRIMIEGDWKVIINTGQPSGEDFPDNPVQWGKDSFDVDERSIVVLMK